MESSDVRPVSPRSRQRVRVGSSDLRAMEGGDARDDSKPEPSTRRLRPKRRRSDTAKRDDGPCADLLTTLRTARLPRSPAKLLRLFLVLVAVLFVFDFVVESLVVAYSGDHQTQQTGFLASFFFGTRRKASTSTEIEEPASCSPQVIDLEAIPASKSRHRFYDLLKRRGTPKPPVFENEFRVLCESDVRHQSRFGYCLPIRGRKDEPFCSRADRMDLLVPSINATGFCYASVLHMLFVEVFEELQAIEAAPVVAYGTLLGAVRNGSMIPYTEDADIGYLQLPPAKIYDLKQRLWAKGLHMFHFTRLWRVCVAPTHPLAAVLYSPEQGLTRNYKVPYVDMYDMVPVSDKDGDFWELFGTREDRLIPLDRVKPYSTVSINGVPFDTFADPKDFLLNEYGADYMTPIPRPERKINGFNFFESFLEDDEDQTMAKRKKDKSKEDEDKEDTHRT